MRNSVNVNLGAGGAMVETGNMDSRPSSTDSCKSNANINDPSGTVSFKDVLVQFTKMSQQQGKTCAVFIKIERVKFIGTQNKK